jgi:hypothetical protein
MQPDRLRLPVVFPESGLRSVPGNFCHQLTNHGSEQVGTYRESASAAIDALFLFPILITRTSMPTVTDSKLLNGISMDIIVSL